MPRESPVMRAPQPTNSFESSSLPLFSSSNVMIDLFSSPLEELLNLTFTTTNKRKDQIKSLCPHTSHLLYTFVFPAGANDQLEYDGGSSTRNADQARNIGPPIFFCSPFFFPLLRLDGAIIFSRQRKADLF